MTLSQKGLVNIPLEFRIRFKKAADHSDWSMQRLGDFVGVSKSTIVNMIQGRYNSCPFHIFEKYHEFVNSIEGNNINEKAIEPTDIIIGTKERIIKKKYKKRGKYNKKSHVITEEVRQPIINKVNKRLYYEAILKAVRAIATSNLANNDKTSIITLLTESIC